MSPDPPADPEEWTHEQWLAWLSATDADPPQVVAGNDGIEPRQQGVASAMLGGALKGLRDALYGPKDDELVIVAPANGPDDDPDMTVFLDPDDPKSSWARLRRDRGTPGDTG